MKTCETPSETQRFFNYYFHTLFLFRIELKYMFLISKISHEFKKCSWIRKKICIKKMFVVNSKNVRKFKICSRWIQKNSRIRWKMSWLQKTFTYSKMVCGFNKMFATSKNVRELKICFRQIKNMFGYPRTMFTYSKKCSQIQILFTNLKLFTNAQYACRGFKKVHEFNKIFSYSENVPALKKYSWIW